MPDPLTALGELFLPAATSRFILLANHVLSASPPATERLRAHAGRLLRLETQGWSLPFPPPPPLSLRISPAGLLEAPMPTPEGQEAPGADLILCVDMSRPLDNARRIAVGELPALQIEGDVVLAADVNWVIANVRWDIGADLERVFGSSLADGVLRAGERLATGARAVAQSAADLLRRP